MKLLVANAADVDAKDLFVTPFVKALRNGRLDIAEFLLQSGVDIAGPLEDREELLVLAATSGFETLALRLIAEGVDANSPAGGWMSLRCALWEAEWTYTGSMWHDPNQGDPIALAMTNVWRQDDAGHRAVAELLIAQGANVNISNSEGRTPLHETVRVSDKDFAMFLIEHGADVDVRDSGNETPLHCAAWDGKTEFAAMLLGHGALVDPRNLDGMTPLNCAARGHKDMVELLLASGADAKTRNKQGSTPLHAAAFRGHENVVRLLLAHGADVKARDNTGRTAAEDAVRRGHDQIVELLGKDASKE